MSARLSIPEVHEVVQLAFLAGLTQRLPARHYILKGGANLRLFLESPRSSEDMDFDAIDFPDWKLADKVNEALRAPVVGLILRSHGLTVTRSGGQKQTATTQRWAVEVQAPGLRLPISTTGEFSHRVSSAGRQEEARSGARADPIDSRIAGRYSAPPIVLPHYLAAAAIEQKIAALALRTVNQPRDVFDLDLLLGRNPEEAPKQGDVELDLAQRAAERASEPELSAFQDAVLPFIDLEVRSFYETPEAWTAMQDRVVAYLHGLA
ncbi:MAG: nucleotidyl transferase AbiEii/AbiGii toxin family protein [Candidatus Limnocylindrales bacterium]